MDAEDFKNSPSGHLIPTIEGCRAFVPNPLPPPALDMNRLIGPNGRANRALGELNGIGRMLPNPDLLVRPFSRVEAVASSKIEGTVSPTPALLMLERNPESSRVPNDTREVNNYNRALRYGLQRVHELPISKRLFCELHEILLEGVPLERGGHIVPGELKKEQNWIGSRTIQTARYVPPPPREAEGALDMLEKFIHEYHDDLPILIKLALIHYQFEAIHPFQDGNGRVGRLIIPLMLCEQKIMSQPLLYLSTFFERHYNNYIDFMFNVSKDGAWTDWVEFFLTGVQVSSENAMIKARAIQDLHRNYMQKIRSARSSALLAKTIDSLFAVPAITVTHVQDDLGISYNSAKSHIKRLVELGILTPRGTNEKPQWFFGTEIVKLINAPDP